jgi:hypothetical protein
VTVVAAQRRRHAAGRTGLVTAASTSGAPSRADALQEAAPETARRSPVSQLAASATTATRNAVASVKAAARSAAPTSVAAARKNLTT